MRPALDGWRSTDRRRADGGVDSAQRVLTAHPPVEQSGDGARRLGRGYWLAVSRASGGLVRCRETERGVELLFLGFRPPLLTFGPAELAVDRDGVNCSYRIAGGLLARRAGGTLSLAQTSGERAELRVAVEGFVPRLGVLYGPAQRRFHVSVSRHYFGRLIAEGQR